jgi:hypothetical protein
MKDRNTPNSGNWVASVYTKRHDLIAKFDAVDKGPSRLEIA